MTQEFVLATACKSGLAALTGVKCKMCNEDWSLRGGVYFLLYLALVSSRLLASNLGLQDKLGLIKIYSHH